VNLECSYLDIVVNMYDLLAHVLSVDKNTANPESVYNKTFFWQIYTLI